MTTFYKAINSLVHVSLSQSNTATQTDDKTHPERTAAAARILVLRAGLQRDMLLA